MATEIVPKNEKEKLASKIDSKNQENKLPFPLTSSQNFDEITLPFLMKKTDDIRSNGKYDNCGKFSKEMSIKKSHF